MQSYDGLLDIAKFPALKKLSQSPFILLITNHFRFQNLSRLLPAGWLSGIRIDAAVPETGSNVGEAVVGFGGGVVGDFVKTLVGRRGI